MKPILLLFFGIGCLIASHAQSHLPDTTRRQVEQLFNKWNDPGKPGCVVAIVRSDTVLYAQGFGLANLEQQVANTPQSVYYMCSVSKQFAGYAIALLARQGKLNLDSDIRQYLPWMQIPGKKITVRHLLNHTSGIRDDISMAAITGLPLEGMLTQEAAINLLKKQRSLNFEPGDKYAYSNSNYVLLAEIVQAVSGQSFRAFTNEQIFQPLGMSSAVFIDQSTETIPGRVASYSKDSKGNYNNSLQHVYTLGDGGLFVNVLDMTKWVMNFYAPKAGDSKDIEQLTERGKLNNGKVISYALGISVDSSRGWKRFMHNGGLNGYRTIQVVYPELKTGFIVFGNGGDNDIYNKPDQLAVLFIPDRSVKSTIATSVKTDSSALLIKDTGKLKQWEGIYFSENGARFDFSRVNGQFRVGPNALVPEGVDSFSLYGNKRIQFAFGPGRKPAAQYLRFYSPVLDEPWLLEKIERQEINENTAKAYLGMYYSPELETMFRLAWKDQQLVIIDGRRGEAKVTLIGSGHLATDLPAMRHFTVKKDPAGRVTTLTLNDGAISHLVFSRMD
ncbi:serine hydrolase domain-containing protein [Paraflavitalea sp. CAU 1676]|uniref:serine hydrolase domain-containing protein n=1 Tax=Paraflavitalea sp. CAU 1676 TaxID=3032598 RepID=UPI0023DABC61|nr:serine hydrolase domain-containing protein [Paraflavitalea sp. CAU 1676]MDF2189265.1 serine hydrolase [Paraflavitalea sp. CAU 1676]